MSRLAELALTHTCPDCGDAFELSSRNTRRHRRLGTVPRCRACRHPTPAPDARELERYRRYWLERFDRDELAELAASIWPRAAESDSPANRMVGVR